MRLYQLNGVNFFAAEVNGGDFPPMVEQTVETFQRKGLEPFMRAMGTLPGQPFQMIEKRSLLTTRHWRRPSVRSARHWRIQPH